MAKQSWDPSVQALAALPEVVKRLGDDIQWTADLGNAFLAQQSDVMDAVQRMRKKAHEKGTLKATEQQKVETKVVENKSVIVIEQANPQVVYVPSYNPVVVWGAPYYPYPPDLLSAVGLLRRGHGDFLRRWRGDGSLLGRRLGLGLRLGWQRHRHQRQQQFQSQLPISSGEPYEYRRWKSRLESAVRRPAEAPATNGSTIPNIAAVPHIGTGLPRTGSGAVRAVIRLLNARPVPSNELAGRAGIWPATVARRRLAADRSRGGAGVGDRGLGGSNRASGSGLGGADQHRQPGSLA